MLNEEKAKLILQRSEIVSYMKSHRIFMFEFYDDDELWLQEACDEYFGTKLDGEICRKISILFSELSECFGEV